MMFFNGRQDSCHPSGTMRLATRGASMRGVVRVIGCLSRARSAPLAWEMLLPGMDLDWILDWTGIYSSMELILR